LGDVVPIQPKPPASQRVQSPILVDFRPSDLDTVIPRHHDTTIESIRKAVKQFGKEAATHRFTREEKQKIAELIFAYSGKGIRTSENEIARIAVNFIVEDHKLNGKDSILGRVLKLLNE
jgi:hypothetical protein